MGFPHGFTISGQALRNQRNGYGETGQASSFGLFRQRRWSEKSLQLTSDPGDCCPTWSPDGRQVAFLRSTDKSLSIYVVPALGGTEHLLYRGPDSMGTGIAWSPDGKSLAFSESDAADTPRSWISLLSLGDSHVTRLTSPPGNAHGSSPSNGDRRPSAIESSHPKSPRPAQARRFIGC